MNQKIDQKNIKICAVICEYNPFHNGHRHQLTQIRRRGGFDLVIGIMSGNFTQRGEAAISDKFTRAEWAVRYGMDAVIELPAPFSSAPAEIFARGGIKILCALPDYCALTLAFGSESGDEKQFFTVAERLLNEPAPFREKLKSYLDAGYSLARARELAYGDIYPEEGANLFSAPNDVLGVEYAKAILRSGRKVELLPLKREGAGHAEKTLRENFSSASSIRAALLQGDNADGVRANVPDGYLFTLSEKLLTKERYALFDGMEYYALLRASEEELRLFPDCSEGLEYALKNATKECFTAEEVIKKVTSRRYPSARIRRILLANALGITAEAQRTFLNGEVFIHPLALRAEKRERILSVLGDERGHAPLVMRKADAEKLRGSARELFVLNDRADDVYAALCGRKNNPFATVFV